MVQVGEAIARGRRAARGGVGAHGGVERGNCRIGRDYGFS